jgi:dephospho-CoA kinase
MIILGLTGGIASGKSFAGGLLAERGAVVLDADRHAHAVLGEPAVLEALVGRWGDSILAEDGSLRRSEVAKRVFGDTPAAIAERRFLEGLVHPRVRQRLKAELAEAARRGVPVAVLDIPLLFEAGWADACAAVLFVDTPLEIRQQRAAKRGWSAEELARREASQMPVDEKRAAADEVIPGDNEAAARAAVERIWRKWASSTGPAD